MNPFEVKVGLNNLTLVIDTREQDTDLLRRRIALVGLPHTRQKLDFGDYSGYTTLNDGTEFTLTDKVAIERKMSLGELCQCYCQGRARFTREFERARAINAKLYLLIEGANWENVITGRYRSKMSPQALRASIMAWLARYDCQLIFCKAESTPILIHDILYRELKERLEVANEQS